MEINESTRVMGAAGGPSSSQAVDRTMVAGVPTFGAPGVGATQMGVTVNCAVCKTNNSGLEAYCGECGFLLTSVPGSDMVSPEEPSGPAFELVENSSGRRFRLRSGPNYVGRENCDILLMDSTVSRRHAHVTLDKGTVTVTDLGSTNGSEVDGGKLTPDQPASIRHGSTVRFGNASLTFSDGSAAPMSEESFEVPADVTVQVDAVPVALSEPTLLEEQDAGEPSEPDELEEPVEQVTRSEQSAPEEAAIAASTLTVAGEIIAVLRPAVGSGAEIPLCQGSYTIGRRDGNDIVIAGDPYISGSHAMLLSDLTGCYLTDIGSTNGSSVNGARLEPNVRQLLLDGDEVTLGQTAYCYETVAPPQPDAQPTAPEAEDSSGTDGAPSAPDQVVN